MLILEKINKIYSNNNGNFEISLTVNDGEVYGLVGPNGAGKTTLIRQILGFIKPDSGVISLNKLDPFKNARKIMRESGYIAGEIALYEGLTGKEYLKIIAKIKRNVDWTFVEKLIDFFSLDVNLKIKKMSKGTKQKTAIIAAMMHKPSFLVLDEPTSGLDIAAAELFKDLIFKFKKEFKTTVIICSHIFDEIARVCDRVGFLRQGRLIKEYDLQKTGIETVTKDFIEIFKDKNAEDLF